MLRIGALKSLILPLSVAGMAMAALAVGSLPAQAFETKAKQALMIDFDSGDVLFEKDADSRMYPASMTKMMTAYMVFERLKNGTLSLDDTLPVSEKAWRKGGSKMFVEVGKDVRIEDLLRGIIIQSGNDATIVVAEGLSGSEEAFAEEMTAKAQELGMTGTRFKNASGWPDPEHYTTARDLVTLATAIIRDYPDYYHFYAETEYSFNGIKQPNRNPLLYKTVGADGLKTGHTEASGYGLTASALQQDRRLVMVLNGMTSKKQRAQESLRVMSWGFREWNRYPLFGAGETVEKAQVWLGTEAEVPMIVAEKVELTMRRKHRDSLKVTLRHQEPVPAPVTKGTQVGTLVIEMPEAEPVEVPLLAAEDVPALGTFGRLNAALQYLVWGEN